MFNFTKLLSVIMILTLLSSLCACAKDNAATSSATEILQGSKIDIAAEEDILDLTEKFVPTDISKLDENEVIEISSSPSFMTSFRTLDEITEKSDYIVSGSAEKVYYTTIGELSYTVVDFLVDESLKGDIKTNSLITVLFLGGYISVEDNIKLKGNADKFSYVPEEKRATTFIKHTVSGAPLPAEKECYVLCLGENENYKGTYYPRNEFETIFKKTGETYERYLPKGYFETTAEKQSEYTYQKSFKLADIKTKIKEIAKTETS